MRTSTRRFHAAASVALALALESIRFSAAEQAVVRGWPTPSRLGPERLERMVENSADV